MTSEILIRISGVTSMEHVERFVDEMDALEGVKVSSAIYRNVPPDRPRAPTVVCPMCRGHGWVLEANGAE